MLQTSAAFFRISAVYNSVALYAGQANGNIRVGEKQVTSTACCLSMPHGNVDVRLQCPNTARRDCWEEYRGPGFSERKRHVQNAVGCTCAAISERERGGGKTPPTKK